MDTTNREDALKCSTGTLMMIYYVIVGLAITEALHNTFLKDESLLGTRAFSAENLPRTLLFFALLPTICRFVHGASMHLGMISDKRYKPLVDFIWFFLQASIFYLMAFSLDTLCLFSTFFCALLVFDTAWLILLRSIQYLKLGCTEIQWLVSNIVIIAFLMWLCIFGDRIPNMTGTSLVLGVAVVATILDYVMNREFYFPSKKTVDP